MLFFQLLIPFLCAVWLALLISTGGIFITPIVALVIWWRNRLRAMEELPWAATLSRSRTNFLNWVLATMNNPVIPEIAVELERQ